MSPLSYSMSFFGLTPRQREIVKRQLTDRGVGACPACRYTQIGIKSEFVVLPLSEHPLAKPKADVADICIALICERCGHMSMFNIIGLGLANHPEMFP